MAAEDHLARRQFSKHLRFEMDEGMVNAYHPRARWVGLPGWVGQMDFDPDTGVVNGIEVDPEHRRKGVATAMWDYAQKHASVKPRHSPSRTPEGDAWAKSLGTGHYYPVSTYVTH
jgi:GNAT superfamily N-acetyltransferase